MTMLDDADDIHPLFHGAPKSADFKKLRKRIVRNTREAIEQYGMIEPGSKWLVCLSGGKDSYTLLAVLLWSRPRGWTLPKCSAFSAMTGARSAITCWWRISKSNTRQAGQNRRFGVVFRRDRGQGARHATPEEARNGKQGKGPARLAVSAAGIL